MTEAENCFETILKSRRSVRRFQQKPLDESVVQKLKESCLRSPASRNLNPWRFFFISDKEILAKLSRVKQHGSDFVKEAALAVVIAADEGTADTWIEDCSIAAIILQLAAESFGLGSCWVQVRMRENEEGRSSEDIVRQVLSLDVNIRVLCIIAIGYPAEPKNPIPEYSLDWHKLK
jgi:nitroreductase